MQIDKNNWQIQITEENRKELEDYIASKYIDKEYVREISRVSFAGEFLTLHDYQIPFFTCYQKNSIPIITTDQFRKYILGKEPKFKVGDKVRINNEKRVYIVKSIVFNEYGIYYCFECGSCATENILCLVPQKIIGYKAPFDMDAWEVKKEDVFIKDHDFYGVYFCEDRINKFPSELVEAYFIPVYEEEKVIELHGYRITKDKITICDGDINIEIEGFKYLTNIRNEVLKAYEELNK